VAEPLLRLHQVSAFYGPVQALFEVDLEVHAGEIVCLLGGNASGKSTTMKTIIGTLPVASGTIELDGRRIERWSPAARVRAGIAIVPEARRVFPEMTVRENLEMGAFTREDGAAVGEDLDRVLALFPRLRERLRQEAGTLSGGEQQMLATGRALMARPRLIIMDEPSMGLAPVLVEGVFDLIAETNALGITIFMVEQNASLALGVADRGYVIQNGHIVLRDTAERLLANAQMRTAYLGGGGESTP
jgi:branched-chain amino acid transport system ATP-binding protein